MKQKKPTAAPTAGVTQRIQNLQAMQSQVPPLVKKRRCSCRRCQNRN